MIGRRANGAVTAPFLGLPMFAMLVAGCAWLPAATPPNVPGGNAAPPDGESAAGIINAYGAEHPEAYAGVYVDGDVLTVLIVGDLVPHEAALRARVPAGTKLAFRPVRWTEPELEALQDRISNASEWFGANDAFLE